MRPYYDEEGITIYHGDCREILPALSADAVVTDPPYGDTALDWDTRADGWWDALPVQQFWSFGSMRAWLAWGPRILASGWKLAEDVVWEKHNGASLANDRFNRVHEHAVRFYRGRWDALYRAVPETHDATARTVRRKQRPHHWGAIGSGSYESHDGGPRLQRSVIFARSCHGSAEHPTQKPVEVVAPLVESCCPPGGTVLDPFMGSGTTLRVAKDLGRCAIGVEVEERYCEIAVRRLAQEVLLGSEESEGRLRPMRRKRAP